MILKRNVLPRRVSDAGVIAFTLIMIPLVYYFELFIVLPTYYTQWGPWYMFHFIMGNFILFNVCSNLVAIIVCDTSIKGRMLTSDASYGNWKLCPVCECLTPPRSFHCNTCNTCILKRDHHCMFTGCCVGHYNHRYFIMFTFYVFIATIYASYYNIGFVWELMDFRSIFEAVVKITFPLAMLVIERSQRQVYMFLVTLEIIVGIFTAVLLHFHGSLILKGVVTHERTGKLSEYDLGKLQNWIGVFGKRWYLVWISPFITSELPQDGINWITKNSVKAK